MAFIDQVGVVVFGLGTLALACLALAMAVSYLVSHDAFYAAMAVLAAGFGVALGYETAAVATNNEAVMPTISHLTNTAFMASPIIWLVALIAIMFVGGNLVVDFRILSRVRSWLVVGAAIAALIVGAVVSALSGWLP